MMSDRLRPRRGTDKTTFVNGIKKSYQLHLLFLLPLVWFVLFCYVPMYGITIAFKDFQVSKGIFGSPWIGLDHFVRFFTNFQFKRILWNSIYISIYDLFAGMPFAIILAVSLHYCKIHLFKKFSQTVTYAPHFISTVVMAGIILQFLHPKVGIVNDIIQALGGSPISFMNKPEYFAHIYVWTDVWQHVGWGSIIYLAALASIDPALHEAAIMDGATQLQRIKYIDIPGIMPTILITLILNCGGIMNVAFEKIFLMQNSLNISASEVISTYVYKIGIQSKLPDYSYATAIGTFNSVVSFVLLVLVNFIVRKFSHSSNNSLW